MQAVMGITGLRDYGLAEIKDLGKDFRKA